MGTKSPFQDAIEQNVPAVLNLLGLRIDAIEVTQAIQYSRADQHLTDPADRGPDNSVLLVAEKPAWVRVYVRSALGAPITGVTGTLTVYGRQLGFLWNKVADLSPQPPGAVTAEWDPDYALERSTLNASLNFVIPAETTCGHLRLDVNLKAPAGYQVTKSIQIEATLRQTLSLRVIPVAYNGPDASGFGTLQLPAPSLAAAQSTAAWSLLVYPVRSTPVIELAPSITLTFPLTGSPASPGACAQSWLNFNALVLAAKVADGNLPGRIYYGLAPAGVPLGFNSGCESNGVSSGLVGGGIAMAHEIGHGLGFQHAPCGLPATAVDPNYPAYEPYDIGGVPGASIGEYGFDINAGVVHSPATNKDFMSYCGPAWISLYNYGRSLSHELLDPTYVCQDEPWWWDEKAYDPFWWIHPPEPPERFKEVEVQRMEPLEPLISILGIHHLTGELEVRSVTRTVASPTVAGGRPTELVAELVDENGVRAVAAPVYRLTSHGGCDCAGHGEGEEGTWLFQAFVPDTTIGSALRLLAGSEQRWERRAPERPPAIDNFDAHVSEGRLDVAWQLGKDDEECEVWLRRPVDEPGRPQIVYVGRGSGRTNLDLRLLPTGHVLLDLAVHDGFHVTTSQRVELNVPAGPPTVAIFHPLDRQSLRGGGVVRLHGVATSADGNPVNPADAHWLLDGAEVASGFDAWIVAPGPGEHRVTLVAEDRFGRGEQTAVLRTVETEFRTSAPDE